METGEPYLMFEDAVNNDLPDFQKRKGLKVHHSNLMSVKLLLRQMKKEQQYVVFLV